MIARRAAVRLGALASRHRAAGAALAVGMVLLAARIELPSPREVLGVAPPPVPVVAADAKPNAVQLRLRTGPVAASAVLLLVFCALGVAGLGAAELLIDRTFREHAPPRAVWGIGAVIAGLVALYGVEAGATEVYRRLSLVTELPDYDPEQPTIAVQLGASFVAGVSVCGVAVVASRRQLGAALGVRAPDPWAGLVAVPAILLASFTLPVALSCLSVGVHTMLGRDVDAQDAAEAVAAASGWDLVAVALYLVALEPLFEELLFRGVVTGALERVQSPRAAAAWSALVFAMFHDPSAMLPVLGTGYLLGLVRRRTGGLVAPFALHASYNALMIVLTVLSARGADAASVGG